MTTLSYLYQLQKADYHELAKNFARVNVVDPDDSELTTPQLHILEDGGRSMFSYLSIGEAEDYRQYWENGNWGTTPPSFLLAENPDWPGNFSVEFWDPDWQNIMLDRITALATQGYNGAYLDIVDAYLVPQVISAYASYSGPGKSGDIRIDMEHFVEALSAAAKAINPDFKIIPQNAPELLAMAGTTNIANTTYLDAIDGVGKEDTFYNGNAVGDSVAEDVQLLDLAITNGKFVLAIDYPTSHAKQEDFIEQALDHGYIPFVGGRALKNLGASIDKTIPGQISPHAFDLLYNGIFIGTKGNDTIDGSANADSIDGGRGHDFIDAGAGNDTIYAGIGNDSVLAGAGDDVLIGDKGKDTLTGGADNDTITGGRDRDVMEGGTGGDTFLFSNKSDSRLSAPDTIQDFQHGVDQIAIAGIAHITSFGDGSGTTLGVKYTVGDDTLVFNTATKFAVLLVGHLTLDAGDFTFS